MEGKMQIIVFAHGNNPIKSEKKNKDGEKNVDNSWSNFTFIQATVSTNSL